MSERAAAILGVCVIVAAMLSTWLSGNLSTGCFQMIRVDNNCLVLDTKTGMVWEKFFPSGSGPSSWTEATGPRAK